MDETRAGTPDPGERWRRLPEAPRAEDWIAVPDLDPVPGSISERSSLTDGPASYGDGLGGGDGD